MTAAWTPSLFGGGETAGDPGVDPAVVPRRIVLDDRSWVDLAPAWITGADAWFDLVDDKMEFRSYFKMPAAQTPQENCVAHNGSVIPVAGRDLMVQSWYQGGVSVWDFTDSDSPRELGYFERGPLPADEGIGGTWSSYYYNGHIYSSDIARGFDTLKFHDPAVKRADTIRMGELNVQSQPEYQVR